MKKGKYIFLLVGILILVLLFRATDINIILKHFKSIGWKFILILSIFFFSNIFLTYGWRVLITTKLKWSQFYKLVLARTAGDATTSINALAAMVGEPLKAMYIKDIVPLKVGLASVVLDRTIHSIANMIMILTGVIVGLFVLDFPWYVSAVSFILTVAFLLILLQMLKNHKNGFMNYFVNLLPKKITNRLINESRQKKIKELDEEIKYVFSSQDNKNHFYISIAMHYFSVTISCALELYLIVYYIQPALNFPLIHGLFMYIFGFIITTAMFFMPANIGTSETSYSYALYLLGYGSSKEVIALGVSIGIIRRFRTFVWAGFGIIILMAAGLWKKKSSV